MEIKESTKRKFEKIWNGLDYHVDELSKFFLENENDPFLKTEFGKKMEEYSKSLCAAYVLGKMTMARDKVSNFITKMMSVDDDDEKPKETEKPEEKGKETTFSMEDMLSSIFGKDNKKEDEES